MVEKGIRMNSAIERLLGLRVSDIMRREAVTASASETMSQAARRLVQYGISGAPVVNDVGECVGVLSAVDFVRRDLLRTDATAANGHRDESVAAHMSSGAVSISAEASLVDAARAMCLKHVHRLPVLDRSSKVIGVISSLDIVAAVVHAVEE
jgi:CBS domain-containing protein